MAEPVLLILSTLTLAYAGTYLIHVWRMGHLASPAALYAALVGVHFAVPGTLAGAGIGLAFVAHNNAAYAPEAMLFALAALAAFQCGSLLAASRQLFPCRVSRPHEQICWNSGRVLLISLVLFVVGWVARLHVVQSNAYFQIFRTQQGELEGPFYAAIRLAEQLPMYAIAILAITYWRPGVMRRRWLLPTLVGFVALDLVYWLPTGRKEPVVLAVLLPLFVRYLRLKRLPSVRGFLAISSVVALLIPLAFVYRNAMEVSGIDTNVIDTAASATAIALAGGEVSRSAPLEVALGRLNLLESIAACIRLIHERTWDLKLGASYAEALLALAPRVIWPDKPDLHYGTEFGHAAGFLGPNDWLTSISVTFFGEAFLNFGWGGVLPLFFMGGMLGAMYRAVRVARRRETWLLVYMAAMPTMLYVGGTFALYFGGLIKILPLCWLLGRLMERTSGAISLARAVHLTHLAKGR